MGLLMEKSELDRLTGGVLVNTDGASTLVIAAPGSGQRLVITDVVVDNAHATTKGTVDVRDGISGAVKATYPAPAASGAIHRLGSPIVMTENTAAAVDVSGAISTITVTLRGYIATA